MSDTDDAINLDAFFAFVSDEGRTVGIGKKVKGEMVGACLAYLAVPVPLSVWLDALRIEPDPEAAARALVKKYGGEQILVVARLHHANVLPPLAGGPVGEA